MNETNLSVTGLKRVQDEATPLRSSLFDLGDSSENPDEPATESAETEFARYLDNRDRMKDPLQLFKDQRTIFPRLSQIVPQILYAPGSTAAVERVFSVAGHILSPKRMSLSDDNFENQLFCNLNRSVGQVRCNKLKL